MKSPNSDYLSTYPSIIKISVKHYKIKIEHRMFKYSFKHR